MTHIQLIKLKLINIFFSGKQNKKSKAGRRIKGLSLINNENFVEFLWETYVEYFVKQTLQWNILNYQLKRSDISSVPKQAKLFIINMWTACCQKFIYKRNPTQFRPTEAKATSRDWAEKVTTRPDYCTINYRWRNGRINKKYGHDLLAGCIDFLGIVIKSAQTLARSPKGGEFQTSNRKMEDKPRIRGNGLRE